jgi:hypothetical protein
MDEFFSEEELLLLRKRVEKLKMQELFHEPCYWEDEEETENDYY